MKRVIIVLSVICLIFTSLSGAKGFAGRPNTNSIFMPTGYTLNAGEFLIGIGPVSYGFSDNVQIGTNVFLFLFQDYNVNVKISLAKSKNFAMAVGMHLHEFDLEVFGADSNFTSISPFMVFTKRTGENTAYHAGVQYSFFSGDQDIGDAVAGATTAGTSAYLGYEHSISHRTKFLVDGGYDFTFHGFRLGGAVLWGWEKFRLKLGVNYFNPENTGGYVMPVLSLWWRFQG